MTAYRLYFTDGDGHIVRGEWIEAESEADAIDIARSRKHPNRVEIWRRMKLVTSVEPHR